MHVHPTCRHVLLCFLEVLNVYYFLISGHLSISHVLPSMHEDIAVVISLHSKEILLCTPLFSLHFVMLVHLHSLLEVGCGLTPLAMMMHPWEVGEAFSYSKLVIF